MSFIPESRGYEAEKDAVRERERRQDAARDAVLENMTRTHHLRIAEHERSERERERREQIELESQRLESVERARRRLKKEEQLMRREEQRSREERLALARRFGLSSRLWYPEDLRQNNDSVGERGERFLGEAISEGNLRQTDRQELPKDGRPRLKQEEGSPRRHTSIDVGLKGCERQEESLESRSDSLNVFTPKDAETGTVQVPDSETKTSKRMLIAQADEGESRLNALRAENAKGARVDEIENNESMASIYNEIGSSLSPAASSVIAACLTDISRGRVTTYTVTIDCLWDLPAFTCTEISADQTLGAVLTLTGTRGEVYAATCEEYMKWRWPKPGLVTLEVVEALLKGPKGLKIIRPGFEMTLNVTQSEQERWEDAIVKKQDPPTFKQSQDLRNNVRGQERQKYETPRVGMRLYGTRSDIVRTTEQIAWLSAVFRRPLLGQVSSSRLGLRSIASGKLELSLHDLQPLIKNDTETSCWLGPFVNSVVAQGFSIPIRRLKGNEGIELPFSTMVSLARVIYPVEYDGGIVLQGFSSLLFPSALDFDSVQWHYISNKDSHSQLPTSVVADLPRVKGVDLEHLMRPRTFLGYCKTVNINLGTEQSGYDRIDYSPAADDRRGPELLASSASIGTSGMGVFGANASANITYPKGLLVNIKIDHFEDILRTARDMPVLLYDAKKGEERGWLVPMLSAILHMAQAWASQVEPNLSHPIPHARLHWNGGQAAYEVFAEHSGLVLYQTLVEKTDYRIKDLITRIWASLNSRIEEQKLVWRATPGAIVLESRRIRGWEFMDIVRPTPLSKMKMQEFHNDCGWNLLGEEVLILFCQGLGEAIKPTEECNVCPVPKGLDYLTASVHCLQSLSKRRGAGNTCSKITNNLSWQPVGPRLFEDCNHKRTPYCEKRPQVFSEILDSCPKKDEEIGIVQTGAVVFGRRAAKLHKAVNGKKQVEDRGPTHPLSITLRNIFHQRRDRQHIRDGQHIEEGQ
ncbi:hypothetical protein MMC28_005476 [Mycoblastus sanguinarius]|nr:hypothetical protein [Mycoblastus sanguinarius]